MKKHTYQKLYQHSVKDFASFWQKQAQEIDWFQPFTQVYQSDQEMKNSRWFVGGRCNIAYNCLDRHLERGNGDVAAIKYLREDGHTQTFSYRQLLHKVQQTAQALQRLGVEKGDRVVTYLPHCPEQVITMLATARIGAIHSVVYAGFSPQALATRIISAKPKVVVTTEFTLRSGKKIPLLPVVEEAITAVGSELETELTTVIVQRSAHELPLGTSSFEKLLAAEQPQGECREMDANDPLFILYTSGTTGSPKGVVHGHGGYNLYTHLTTKYSFGLSPGDVFWCAADTGWITGHSYGVYGPLSNGVTSIIYEGSPLHPDANTWWRLIEQHQVKAFYTSPTAIRMLMKASPTGPAQFDLSSLEVVGSVGEPINPTAWEWFHSQVGSSQAAVIDTWWQTETGGHVLVTMPGIEQKPGKAGLPFFGAKPAIVSNDQRTEQDAQKEKKGQLYLQQPWPGMLIDCWNDHDRYLQYFTENGFYTGDIATIDQDNYIQVLGRDDDVLNVSGVRLGSAEIENVLVSHPAVVEAAVIGIPDELTGESITAFVVLHQGKTLAEPLEELRNHVKKNLTHAARPKTVRVVDKLPKTRSGKIMRRLLRGRELGLELGDTSTLED